MRKVWVLAALSVISSAVMLSTVSAQTTTRGYTNHKGTYVQPYTRSTPDRSYNNNYSVQGNQNPYTGQQGTRSPTYNDRSPSYNQQHYGNPGYMNNNNSYRR